MIVQYVFVDIFVYHVYLDKMLKKLIIAVALVIVVYIQFLVHVIYVGYHITWNDKFYVKNMVYVKNHVEIVQQHFVVVLVQSVKKLDFLIVKVYFIKIFLLKILSFTFLSYTTTFCRSCCCSWTDAIYQSTSTKLLLNISIIFLINVSQFIFY